MSQLDIFKSDTPKHTSFEQLLDSMMAMTDDPLSDAGTNIVICRGNPSASLMLIGEAPGPQENIQGKPFVGRAGQLLDKIFAAVNFNMDQDVFITNSVFRMPPGDQGKVFRKPKTEEIDYYRKYVLEIIRILDPSIILLSGNVACQSLLKKTGITKLRGHWTQMNGRWIMPIFHPSYLLRNPSRNPDSPKALMWEDIREVRKKYDDLFTSST